MNEKKTVVQKVVGALLHTRHRDNSA